MDEGRFTRLPEPIRLEDTLTSKELTREEPVIDLIVDAWNAAG